MGNLVKLLQFGRRFGLENVSQMQMLRKQAQIAIAKGEIPAAMKGQFKFPTQYIQELQEFSAGQLSTEVANLHKQMMKLAKKYSPKAYAPDTETVLGFNLRRLGKRSGILEVNTTNSTNSALGRLKVWFNGAGVRAKVAAKAETGLTKADVTYLRDGKEVNPFELAKNVTIQSDNNLTTFAINKTKSGKIVAEAEAIIPTEIADRTANIMSRGQYYDVADMQDALKVIKG